MDPENRGFPGETKGFLLRFAKCKKKHGPFSSRYMFQKVMSGESGKLPDIGLQRDGLHSLEIGVGSSVLPQPPVEQAPVVEPEYPGFYPFDMSRALCLSQAKLNIVDKRLRARY
jgi:hypothetical protein